MEEIVFKVEGMSCKHCVAAVQKALEGVPGVAKASVSLENATVQAAFDPAKANAAQLKAAIEDQGYDVVG